MSNVPDHLPGDLGEHDPRREAHPIGNEPGSGGHEVKLGSSEAKGTDSGATAAEHSTNNDPSTDNTAEHALEGGSTESMDRQKRQHNSSIPGGRTGHDGVDDHLTRAGHEQESTRDTGLTGNHGSHSRIEPISGVVGGAPYDAGNVQSTGFGSSDPQERHQLHHGTAHHAHDFSHNHTTRTGELLDPASGRDTGIPGYAGGASGLTGSSTTGTGYEQTGSTGEHLREDVREGERAVGSHNTTGHHGSTGSGLTGSTTGHQGETTGERLKDDVREGEHATGHKTTGTTGDNTTTGTTGEHKKASLLDKLNPMKDSDGDGKKGFMK